MNKDIGVVIALPAELKHRVDAMAAQVGLSAQTLMLAWVLQGMKGPAAAISTLDNAVGRAADYAVRRGSDPAQLHFSSARSPVYPQDDDDAWRGPPDDEPQPASDVDVDAMIANRVAEAESAGLAQPPGQAYEAFGPPTPTSPQVNVRSLRRPPPQFAPANQPHHLRSL